MTIDYPTLNPLLHIMVINMSCMKHVIDAIDLLDRKEVLPDDVEKFFKKYNIENYELKEIKGTKGKTLFVKIFIEFVKEESEKQIKTLGIIGRLGGVGARPHFVGLVSDADGAIVALATAFKLAEMKTRGDYLNCNVIITTHISTHSPIIPHEPKPFVGSPVDMMTLLRIEVDPQMDAILSIDATKANKVIKVEGFAITPTVKEGIILKVSDDLIEIYERVMDRPAAVVPITMQDILPASVNVYHINTMMLPWLVTDAPIVGVALTSRNPISGCATGANYIYSLERATTFSVEVAKEFGKNQCQFYDTKEFETLKKIYGDLAKKIRMLAGIK